MSDWPATLRICQRNLRKGGCCLGLNMKKHGWCSTDRHKDHWEKCGMEVPDNDRNPDRPGGVPTREDILEAFREEFRSREFPERATDAEIEAELSKYAPVEGGAGGPGRPSRQLKITAKQWKFWVHWNNLNPAHTKVAPVLSGKRAFIAVAREAFGIGMPGAIETLAMPVAGEVLPPEDRDTLAAAFSGLDVDAPWTDTDQARAIKFKTKFETGVRFFVQCGEILSEARDDMIHGRFMRWIDEELPISARTARTFMQIYRDGNIRRYLDGEKWPHAAVLPPDRTVLAEICGMEPEQFDGLVEEGVIHAEMKRGDVRRRIVEERHGGAGQAEPPALPDGQYGAILMDPPWPFDTRGAGGKGRAADNHYPTMTMSRISALGEEIAARAAENSALFLWATSDRLADAIELMERWGFLYRSTAFVWVKEGAPGLGYWTRKGAEICLLGTRGKPKRLAADVAEVIHAPRREHSRKPDEVYVAIQALVAGPYLEVFARKAWPGWDAWGNDPALAGEEEA